jgi:hypothetical protein
LTYLLVSNLVGHTYKLEDPTFEIDQGTSIGRTLDALLNSFGVLHRPSHRQRGETYGPSNGIHEENLHPLLADNLTEEHEPYSEFLRKHKLWNQVYLALLAAFWMWNSGHFKIIRPGSRSADSITLVHDFYSVCVRAHALEVQIVVSVAHELVHDTIRGILAYLERTPRVHRIVFHILFKQDFRDACEVYESLSRIVNFLQLQRRRRVEIIFWKSLIGELYQKVAIYFGHD